MGGGGAELQYSRDPYPQVGNSQVGEQLQPVTTCYNSYNSSPQGVRGLSITSGSPAWGPAPGR